MKGRVWLTVFLLVFICLASTAFAEQVVEVWRYPLAGMEGLAASAANGSAWIIGSDGVSVARLAPGLGGDLQEVARVRGFVALNAIAANSADGSCWVGDCCFEQVVHLAADGTELSRTGGMGQPYGLSVDSTDGSCWVIDRYNCEVIHLAANGTELSRTAASGLTGAIAAAPGTNSCWFGDCYDNLVVHLQDNLDGSTTILSTTGGFSHLRSLSVDSGDNTVWIADCDNSQVTHLEEDPEDHTTAVRSVTPIARPVSISAVAGAGAWVVERCPGGSSEQPYVVHLDTEGNVDITVTDLRQPNVVSVDGSDQSCWVLGWAEIAHLTAAGETRQREPGVDVPWSVGADPNDGSSWMADCQGGRVWHLSADRDAVVFEEGFGRPTMVAVNPADGSVWVADVGQRCVYDAPYNQVIHLAADGSEIARTDVCCPVSLAVDPNDGSCWVTQVGGGNCAVMRVAAEDGSVAFGICLPYPTAVAVDPNDSSVWLGFAPGTGPVVALQEIPAGDVIVHFAEVGGEPWLISATPVPTSANGLAVDPVDSSCVATLGEGVGPHALAGRGREALAPLDGEGYIIPALRITETPSGPTMAALGSFWRPMGVSVDPADRSIWIADGVEVGHMAADGTVLSRTGGYCCVASVSVDPSDGSCWMSALNSADVALLAVAPEAEFTASAESGVVPFEVSFTDLSSGSPFSWEWSFGDGGTSAEQNPTHTYGLGHYTVSLTIEAAGGSDTETKINYIYAGAIAPTANFSGTPTAGPAPLTVSFEDLSTNGPTQWLWSFGDGGASTAQNPTHVYQHAGTYTVSLLAANGQGFDTETKVSYIDVEASVPTADFSATPTTGRAPLTVSFEDLSTNGPTQWLWSFGDGGISTEQNPTHEYEDQGSYTVGLVVANAQGFDSEVKTDYITVQQPLVAAFSTDVTRGASPLEVHFTDESTGGATWWLWTFGDGATSTAQDPIHFYEDPGFYTVTLLVGSEDVTDSVTKADCLAVGFTDTPGDFWAFLEVVACAEADIVDGYWDGSYDPEGLVTRAQMATFLARALAGGDGNVPSGPATPTFADVGEDHWAYKYVEYCADLDIVEGYWNNTYRPEVVVNRGQMAVFIARAVAVPTGMEDYVPPEDPTFWDVTSTNDWAWCYKYVEYIAALDPPVVQGYPDGRYRPELDVTRDQMAVYMQRAFDLPIPSPPP